MTENTLLQKLFLFSKFLFREFISPLNYAVALLIGAIINYLQGFGAFSSWVAFVVPIIVQSISKASVKYGNRHLNLLVKLPAERNDPAFIIDDKGTILLSGGITERLFHENSIKLISDIFEDFSLNDISNKHGEQGVERFSNILGSWYILKIKPESETGTCLVWMQDITELHNAREHAESMALFGKLNPEPVIRCNKKGLIIESNPAANESFNSKSLVGENVSQYISQISCLDITKLISSNAQFKISENYQNQIYRFMFRGISKLNICQIYGSNITERVLAERKIKQQNKNITDSIEYARRIQNAVLPSSKTINNIASNHFILFQPCQIVSGDFYWVKEVRGKTYIVAADCTGHGVPGGFMSMLGIAFLNEIASREDCNNTALILNELRHKVKTTLSQSDENAGAADGMDISLIIIDNITRKMQFSGAYNHLLLYRNGEPEIIKADRMPIGKYIAKEKSFSLQERQLEKGDVLYMFSDGYRDQFGGENDTKYSGKRFRNLLTSIHLEPMNNQLETLSAEMNSWKGDREQIDDILVVGIKI